MEAPELPSYVSEADRNFVVVIVHDEVVIRELESFSFRRVNDRNELIISVDSQQDKAKLFEQLRALRFCFARGREWSPAEVFEYLRDRGLISGSFSEIVWTKPDVWQVREGI